MFFGTSDSSSFTSRSEAELTELFGEAKVILSIWLTMASSTTGLRWPTLTEAVPASVSI